MGADMLIDQLKIIRHIYYTKYTYSSFKNF